MGKASRRKHAEEQQRLYFDIKGDARNTDDRKQARVMLEKLQQKLVDDASREDGFYFVDGKYTDARRPRVAPGMKTQSFAGHKRTITDVALVPMVTAADGRAIGEGAAPVTSHDLNSFVVTFATDWIGVWNMKTGEQLGSWDVSSKFAVSICGAATRYQGHQNAVATGGDPTTLLELEDMLCIAFATHHGSPVMLTFDTLTNQFSDQRGPAISASNGVAHQQQITCMAFTSVFSTTAEGAVPLSPLRLATGSLDSTCILWELVDHEEDKTFQKKWTMLMVLPGSEAGVTSCLFTHDDHELISVGGDGVVKLWRVDDVQTSLAMSDTETPLEKQREQWAAAEPYTLSVAQTMDLLLYDGALPSFHMSDDWVYHTHRESHGRCDILFVPAQAEQPTAQIEVEQQEQQQQRAPDEPLAGAGKDPTPQKSDRQCEGGNPMVLNSDPGSGDNSSNNDNMSEPLGGGGGVLPITPRGVDVELLRREFAKMDSFDFEQILNPMAPLLGESANNTHRVVWPVLTPNGDGRLIQTFTSRKQNGDFAAHTSRVTDCAVAKEADLVVTVSLDKSILCWSLSKARVVSITRDAHDAPITSCALTSPTTTLRAFELLLATAGKDNLIKVWQSVDSHSRLHCVYTLPGHYDAITALHFDASGIFLVSCSDDTLAHCWRVRPAAPDAPTKPDVVTIDRCALTIRWRPPLANGAALIEYRIHTDQLTSQLDGSSTTKPVIKDVVVTAKYTTVTVDTLQPGITYRLCVAAVNSVGQSLWSEPTDAIETLAFAPSKIENSVQYHDITPSGIHLSWKAPCASGAEITTYHVKALPENRLFVPAMQVIVPVGELLAVATPSVAEQEQTRRRDRATGAKKVAVVAKRPGQHHQQQRAASTTVYEYVMQDLWPGEVYQFIVAAENRCGVGDFCPFSDYIKMESTAPDAPSQPLVTKIDKRLLDVSWVKPRSNGSEILQYIIEWAQLEADTESDTSAHRQSVVVLTKSIVGTTYTIHGLKPGHGVRVWVAATNLVHGKLSASPFSEPSDLVTTLCDVPDKPEKPLLVSASAHSIVIVVSPPCGNGLEILQYEIALFSEEMQFGIATKTLVRDMELTRSQFDKQDHNNNSDGSMSSSLLLTVLALRANTFYSATVVAINALGKSAGSGSSVAMSTKPAVVPCGLEDPPAVCDIEPTRATLSWKEPRHDGGAPLASFVLQYSIDKGAFDHEIVLFQAKTQLILEHLKPKATYQFRVTTANAVGRAPWSPVGELFTTPSLVEFTITNYFATRPAIEHTKAMVIQRRYRLWKRRVRDQRVFLEKLTLLLATSWHIL